MANVRYVIARNLGSHDEYLTIDKDWGPLVLEIGDHVRSTKAKVTATLATEDDAWKYVEIVDGKYPSVARFEADVKRIP